MASSSEDAYHKPLSFGPIPTSFILLIVVIGTVRRSETRVTDQLKVMKKEFSIHYL